MRVDGSLQSAVDSSVQIGTFQKHEGDASSCAVNLQFTLWRAQEVAEEEEGLEEACKSSRISYPWLITLDGYGEIFGGSN